MKKISKCSNLLYNHHNAYVWGHWLTAGGREETDGLCKGKKKTACYSQDHVLQQMTTLHVIKITTCVFIQPHPTTDMDIDKTAKAFGEWGKMTAHTHKRRGTCTEAVGLIRLSFSPLTLYYRWSIKREQVGQAL